MVAVAAAMFAACSGAPDIEFGVVIVNPCDVDVSVSIGLLRPDRIPTPPLRTVPSGGELRYRGEASGGFDVVLTAPDIGWDLQYGPEPDVTRTVTINEHLCPTP